MCTYLHLFIPLNFIVHYLSYYGIVDIQYFYIHTFLFRNFFLWIQTVNCGWLLVAMGTRLFLNNINNDQPEKLNKQASAKKRRHLWTLHLLYLVQYFKIITLSVYWVRYSIKIICMYIIGERWSFSFLINSLVCFFYCKLHDEIHVN